MSQLHDCTKEGEHT